MYRRLCHVNIGGFTCKLQLEIMGTGQGHLQTCPKSPHVFKQVVFGHMPLIFIHFVIESTLALSSLAYHCTLSSTLTSLLLSNHRLHKVSKVNCYNLQLETYQNHILSLLLDYQIYHYSIIYSQMHSVIADSTGNIMWKESWPSLVSMDGPQQVFDPSCPLDWLLCIRTHSHVIIISHSAWQ